MLTSRIASAAVTLTLLSAGLAVLPRPAAALAQDQPIACAPGAHAVRVSEQWLCVLFAGGPASSLERPLQVRSITGGGAYERWCREPLGLSPTGFGGAPAGMVPCHLDGLGWWDGTNCYYQRSDEPPDDAMIGYDEHGADGIVYVLHCFLEDLNADGLWQSLQYRVLPEPPPFEGGQPAIVVDLWMDAVNQLVMTGPDIGTAPPSGQGAALVRVPVWMWHNGGRSTGPVTAGPAAGQTVSAAAELVEIAWDAGDGTRPEICTEWTAWRQGMDVFDAPCGHTYGRSSRDAPDGRFAVVATATWHLQWWVNGEWDGELRLPAGATTALRVDEIQVLTR